MVKISDLRMLDVINVGEGKRLGMIKDIELDLENGKIKAIVLPGNTRAFNLFSKSDEVVVQWDKIVRIGVDVILVDLNPVAPIK